MSKSWTVLWLSLLFVASFGYAVLETRQRPAGAHVDLAVGFATVVNTPMFVAYIVLPLWIGYCALDAKHSCVPAHLIRSGTFARHVRVTGWRALRILGLSTLSVAAGSTLVPMLGVAQMRADDLSVAALFDAARIASWMGALSQVGLLTLALVLARLTTEILTAVDLHRWAVAGGIAAGLWSVLSASGVVTLGGLQDFRAYTCTAYLLTLPTLSPSVIVAYACWLTGLVLSVVSLDRRVARRPWRMPVWVPASGIALLLLTATATALGTGAESLVDHVIALHYGPGSTIVQLMLHVTLVVGYTFAASIHLPALLGPWGQVAALRYGSRRAQLIALGSLEARAAVAYCATTLLATVIAYLLVGGRDLSFDERAPLAAFQLLVAQPLQILLNLALVTAALLATQRETAGLIVVGILTALSSLPVPASLPWLVQRSTTAVISDGGWPVALSNTGLLAVATIAIVGFVARGGRARTPAPPRHQDESVRHRKGVPA